MYSNTRPTSGHIIRTNWTCKYSFHGSPYSSILMIKKRASHMHPVKNKDPYRLKGTNFGILPHFRNIKKRKISKDCNGKATAEPSPLKTCFLPAFKHVFPAKRMQVYVEEFDPGGSSKDDTIDMDTNIDSVNKGINKDIKEEMRKEIEKQAEIIELTPPPFPLLGQQLTVRYHVLEKSSDRGGAETQLRPSWAQAERDGEIEVLMGKEKERVQNLEMAKFMAEKENEARMRDLFTLELRESAEDRSRSQDVKVRRKKKKQKKRKRNKARRREKRRQ